MTRDRSISVQMLDSASISHEQDSNTDFSDQGNDLFAIVRNLRSAKGSSDYHRMSEDAEAQQRIHVIDDLQTFTLDDAFERLGGFGKFQIIALVLLSVMREMGHFHLQALALLVMPPESYIC